ncbi:Uncharacterized protein family (UPF0261) domain containing protein [Tylopilus felleus]
MFPRYCARNHDPRPHDYPSRLSTQGSIAGVISAGGSGNTGVCATAFRDAFPIGFPKLLVSTMAPGNTRHYVGETDMTMMYSVVDIAGMNALFHTILGNAAVAIVGMTLRPRLGQDVIPTRWSVGVTMWPHDSSRHWGTLSSPSMERLIREGYLVGVLDLTTTELADELVGGVLSAGPNRLEAVVDKAIP